MDGAVFPPCYLPGAILFIIPGSEVKASACNVGDLGLILGSGRSPGEGNGNPLQYSSHGRRSLVGYSPWGRKESDTTERLHPSNYGGGNEDNGHLLQNVPCMYCYTQCPQPCSRPPPTHASTG